MKNCGSLVFLSFIPMRSFFLYIAIQPVYGGMGKSETLMESENENPSNVLPGLSIPEYPNDVWLIGQTPDEKGLVEVNEQQVLFMQEDNFTCISPAEHLE